MIVVDTNIIVSALMDSGSPAQVVVQRDPHWVAPPIWRSEFRNVMAGFMRVRDMPATEALRAYQEADVMLVDGEVDVETIFRLLAASPCTAYDLEFVALAQRLEVPLVTLDRQLLIEFPGLAMSPQKFVSDDV